MLKQIYIKMYKTKKLTLHEISYFLGNLKWISPVILIKQKLFILYHKSHLGLKSISYVKWL